MFLTGLWAALRECLKSKGILIGCQPGLHCKEEVCQGLTGFKSPGELVNAGVKAVIAKAKK